jgi:hypothetical protein
LFSAFILGSTKSTTQNADERTTMIAWLALRHVFLASLILRFDGSWKHPRDPEFPTSSLGRMAACAACIIIPEEQQPEEVTFVGGRRLDAGMVRGSAEAEYEGVILGLDGLLKQYRNISDVNEAFRSSSAASSTPVVITIEGDCKTVIDQLQGNAHPRKLEQYYKRAIDLIRQLPFEFQYQHIPRAENELCDRICARILEEQQFEALESAYQELAFIYTNATLVGEEGSSEDLLSSFLHRHFGSAGNNYIPLSQRPALYRSIASTASRIRDFATILAVGNILETEVKSVWSTVRTPSPVSSIAIQNNESEPPVSLDQRFKDTLLTEAVVYQVVGLHNLGKHKQEALTTRKNRYILEKYSEYAATLKFALTDEASSAPLLEMSGRASAASKIPHTGKDEWPPLVEHWHDEALRSDLWRDETVYWMAPIVLSSMQQT